MAFIDLLDGQTGYVYSRDNIVLARLVRLEGSWLRVYVDNYSYQTTLHPSYGGKTPLCEDIRLALLNIRASEVAFKRGHTAFRDAPLRWQDTPFFPFSCTKQGFPFYHYTPWNKRIITRWRLVKFQRPFITVKFGRETQRIDLYGRLVNAAGEIGPKHFYAHSPLYLLQWWMNLRHHYRESILKQGGSNVFISPLALPKHYQG